MTKFKCLLTLLRKGEDICLTNIQQAETLKSCEMKMKDKGSFWKQTDRQMNICDCRVASAAENNMENLISICHLIQTNWIVKYVEK